MDTVVTRNVEADAVIAGILLDRLRRHQIELWGSECPNLAKAGWRLLPPPFVLFAVDERAIIQVSIRDFFLFPVVVLVECPRHMIPLFGHHVYRAL